MDVCDNNINLDQLYSLNRYQCIELSEQIIQQLDDETLIGDSGTTLKSLFELKEFKEIDPHNNNSSAKTKMAKLISRTTTQVYLRKIEQVTIFEIFHPLALKEFQCQNLAMSKVVLPALFAKNILIRPPLPSERKVVLKKFEMNCVFKFKRRVNTIVENEGLYFGGNKTHRIFVSTFQSNINEINAVIRYKFKTNNLIGKKCIIDSLCVRPDVKGIGIGTLLLSYAILDAIQNQCKKVSLYSSVEGASFYLLHGFEPDEICEMRQFEPDHKLLRKWERANLEKRKKICEKFERNFSLTIGEERLQNIQNRLFKVLNSSKVPVNEKSRIKSASCEPMSTE